MSFTNVDRHINSLPRAAASAVALSSPVTAQPGGRGETTMEVHGRSLVLSPARGVGYAPSTGAMDSSHILQIHSNTAGVWRG